MSDVNRESKISQGWRSRNGERKQTGREAKALGNFMVKLLRACVGMPRHRKAMKDVANCEMLRGAVSTL